MATYTSEFTGAEIDTILSSVGTITTEIGTIDTSINTIDSEIDTINTSIGNINIGVGAINTAIGTINTDIDTIDSEIDTINTSIGTINTKLTKFDNIITVAKTGYANFVCSDTVYAGSDAACIQAAINYAPDHSTIMIFNGTYTIDTVITNGGKSLSIYGVGNVIFNLTASVSGTGTALASVQFSGTSISTAALSSNVSSGGRALTLSSVESLQRGDLIQIYNTTKWYPWLETDNWKPVTGELYRISSAIAGVSTTDVTLTENLIRDYASADTTIILYRPAKICIENIKFVGASPTTVIAGIALSYCADSQIINCGVSDNGFANLIISTCYNTTIEKSKFSDAYSTGLGYGVAIMDASSFVNISGDDIENCRHCITSGETVAKGLNRGVVITKNHLKGANLSSQTANVIDAHPMTIDYTVVSNDIYVGIDTNSSYGEFAFADGTQRSTFANNTIYGGGGVISRGGPLNCTHVISNNNITESHRRGICRYIEVDVGGVLNVCGNSLNNVSESLLGAGIYVDNAEQKTISISNNTMENCGECGIIIKQLSTTTQNIMINIDNNTINHVMLHGIWIQKTNASVSMNGHINNNTVLDVNQSTTSTTNNGIFLDGASNLNVQGNIIKNITGTMYRFIRETGISDNNYIINNTVDGFSLAPAINGAGTIFRENKGYVTENNGTATITASATTVSVTHGLAATPTRVQLTPTTDTTGVRYWVSAKGATTFTITINATAASDISFDWKAMV